MDSGPVKIYSTKDVPRLRYIAGIILEDILGLSWELITDKRKLGKHPVINYSDEKVLGSFKITPDKLLFETGVNRKEISVTEWRGLPVFFHTSSDSDLPFDVFAASFFLISRYEEYLEYEPDEHGRFRASSSLAFRHGFLGIPVVDKWVKEFSKTLLKKFQTLAFKRNQFQALLTMDTDEPFAYLGKGLLRSLGGFFKDMKRNGSASNRYKSVTGEEKDPYQVFDYVIEKIEKTGSDAKFFFPVGDRSRFDQNPAWKNEEYRQLIRKLSAGFQTGLHPSFYAADNLRVLRMEASRLKTILGTDIVSSRFHYLRLTFPKSYRDISDIGIASDYTMGYQDEPGFRAGIARPFSFYDLLEDKSTSLKVIPFQVMDATLFQYKKLDPEASRVVISNLIDETRKEGGLFVSIWHNTSLLDNNEWHAWRDVFEFMLKYQKS